MVQYFQALTSDAEREPFGNQIAAAFCSMAELYLTDLWYGFTTSLAVVHLPHRSFAPTAETDCAQLIDLALKYGPNSPEPLQLLCNFRISQQRNADALAALQRRCGACGKLISLVSCVVWPCGTRRRRRIYHLMISA